MPRFDGTGPRGEGPFTGGGRGYCAMSMPRVPGVRPFGYAGLQGTPIGPAARWAPAPQWRGLGGGRRRALRGRGGRGRGRW